MDRWLTAQDWERQWWDKCVNTFGEETKQLIYANRMGLETFHDGKSPHNFDLKGQSVLDIGGGPTSLLLKCVNFERAKVIDPLQFPDWVLERYKAANIEFESIRAEEIEETGWRECWVYNVLQHTANLELVIRNLKKSAKLIRIFEWINTPVNKGHLHSLSSEKLNEWLGGIGKVEELRHPECFGTAYYGVFYGHSG